MIPKSEIQAEASSDIPIIMRIPIDQAKGLTLGDKVSLVVSGEISAMRKPGAIDTDSKTFEIEIRNPQKIEVQSNQADMELKKMIQRVPG